MSLLLAFAPFIVFAIVDAWAAAFLIMAVADLIFLYMPEWSPRIGIIAAMWRSSAP